MAESSALHEALASSRAEAIRANRDAEDTKSKVRTLERSLATMESRHLDEVTTLQTRCRDLESVVESTAGEAARSRAEATAAQSRAETVARTARAQVEVRRALTPHSPPLPPTARACVRHLPASLHPSCAAVQPQSLSAEVKDADSAAAAAAASARWRSVEAADLTTLLEKSLSQVAMDDVRTASRLEGQTAALGNAVRAHTAAKRGASTGAGYTEGEMARSTGLGSQGLGWHSAVSEPGGPASPPLSLRQAAWPGASPQTGGDHGSRRRPSNSFQRETATEPAT